MFRSLSIVLCLLMLSSCSYLRAHKIDIQQGNILTQEMASQLKPGLTKEQVRFILGSPMLTDMFHASRWEYVYRVKHGATNKLEMRQFSVFFDDHGRLTRVAGDVVANTDKAAKQATDPHDDKKKRFINLSSLNPDGSVPPRDRPTMMERINDFIEF